MDRYSIESLLLRSSCSRIAPLLTPDVRSKSTLPTYPSPMLFQQVHYSALDTKMLCYTAFRLRLAKDRLMPEFTPEAQERAKAWLREQVKPEDDRKGVSTYKIRDILKRYTKKGPSQSTVARAVQALEDDEDLEKTMMRAIMALFVSEEAEAERIANAKAAAPQPANAVEGDAASTQRAEAQPTEPTVYEQWNERQKKLVHDELGAVITRQFERGLVPETDVAQFNVRGDGVYYLENLQTFDYQDEGAEAVGFLNKGDMLPDGRPAGFYTDGVSPEWRQRKWALPKDAPRNQMIGDHRPANLVPVVPYIDKTWFWDDLKGAVDSWWSQLRRFESWITDGVPPMPSREYAAAYEKLLYLTAQLHEMKIAYEGTTPSVTNGTLKQDIDILRLGVLRGEDAEKASQWVARIARYILGLIVVSLVFVWAGPTIFRGGMSLKATAENWLPTARQWGAELGLMLASPWLVGTLLIIAVIFFLIRVYYTSTLEPWENKSAVRWTAIVGGLVFLLAAALVASVIAFEIVPRLDEFQRALTSSTH